MTEWHVVKLRPGAEGKTMICMDKLGLQTFLPVELIRINHRTGHETSWRPLFLGYLFVQCDIATDFSKLMEIEGVQQMLSARIPDGAIEAIQIAEQHGVWDRMPRRTPRLSHGDDVVIQDGPFAHLVAKIKSERPSKRMKRCMELVGNFPFRVTADVRKVEKVA